jgi:transposase
LDQAEQAALKTAVGSPPRAAGIEAATWSWKAVRQFVAERFGKALSPRSCLRWLHRLNFVWKRPKRRLLKADGAKREACVWQYRAAVAETEARDGRIVFVDEAHFRADGDLHGLWVPKGDEALVASVSPRYGEKTSWYSAVCLETGEVLGWEIDTTSTAASSAAFLQQVRERFAGPLTVIWDNGPAHRGEALREYLRTPRLDLRLLALPAYSPDYNADELVWKWVREEVTANTCFGTAARVAAAVRTFFQRLTERRDEVKQRCRSELQTAAFPETSKHPERRAQRLQTRAAHHQKLASSM